MAHTKSALKRIRQTATRTARNRAANSRVRTLRKKIDPSRSIYLREVPKGVEVFDIQGPLFFGVVEKFKDIVLKSLEHDVSFVVLRMRLVPVLDATGLHVLEGFFAQCREHGIRLMLCGVQAQPLEVIRHAPMYRQLKKCNVCANIDEALARIRGAMEKEATPAVRDDGSR